MRAQTLARTFSVLQKAAAKPKGEKKPKAKATPKVGGGLSRCAQDVEMG